MKEGGREGKGVLTRVGLRSGKGINASPTSSARGVVVARRVVQRHVLGKNAADDGEGGKEGGREGMRLQNTA